MCIIHTCDMTYSYVWHDSSMRVTWFGYVTWRIHICDMTRWYVGHDSVICVTCLIDVWHYTIMTLESNASSCAMCEGYPTLTSHSCSWRDTLIWEASLRCVFLRHIWWVSHMMGVTYGGWWVCDVTHSCMGQGLAWHLSDASHMWWVCETTWHAMGCVTRRIHVRHRVLCHTSVMPHICHGCVRHHVDGCVTWRTYVCDRVLRDTWVMRHICERWVRRRTSPPPHTYTCRGCVTWRIYVWDRTHAYFGTWHSDVGHDSCIVRCVIGIARVGHDALLCVTWLIATCHMTHSYVSHDSFLHVTWLIPMCHMTHSYVSHDSRVGHDSLLCVTWLFHRHTCDQYALPFCKPRCGCDWRRRGAYPYRHVHIYLYTHIYIYVHVFTYTHIDTFLRTKMWWWLEEATLQWRMHSCSHALQSRSLSFTAGLCACVCEREGDWVFLSMGCACVYVCQCVCLRERVFLSFCVSVCACTYA